jgi:hypothetical protein
VTNHYSLIPVVEASRIRQEGAMSQKHSERMWEMAYDLARSGAYRTWAQVALELQSRGFSQARWLLDTALVRKELNHLCAAANTKRVAA